MKKKDLNDIRTKSVAEIETLAAKLKAEIVKAQMDLAAHRSKNTNSAKNFKKNLAQMLTIKKELEKNAKL